jgi:hypothetical protein
MVLEAIMVYLILAMIVVTCSVVAVRLWRERRRADRRSD